MEFPLTTAVWFRAAVSVAPYPSLHDFCESFSRYASSSNGPA